TALRLGQTLGVVVESTVSAGLAGEFGASDDGVEGGQPMAFALPFAVVRQAAKALEETGQILAGNTTLHGQFFFIGPPRLGQNRGGQNGLGSGFQTLDPQLLGAFVPDVKILG